MTEIAAVFDVSPTAGMIVGNSGSPSPDRLLADVCAANDIRPSQLRGSSRHASVVAIRRLAAQVLRDAGCSLPEIGRLIGRHHTTVMNLLDESMSWRKLSEQKARGSR